MQKKDLKIGGYYVSSKGYLFKLNDLKGDKNPHTRPNTTYFSMQGGSLGMAFNSPFTQATQEQIDHLNACIAAGEYVEAPKKPKFEVGKWYHVTLSGKFDHYFKFEKIDNERAVFDNMVELIEYSKTDHNLPLILTINSKDKILRKDKIYLSIRENRSYKGLYFKTFKK